MPGAGAHFVDLLFYEPRSFVDDPIRILRMRLGLASHGGSRDTLALL